MRTVSPARSFTPQQLVGQLGDPLLVGPADDHGAPSALEHLLEGDDLPGDFPAARHHHVEALVEDDLLAALQLLELEIGVEGYPHLAAGAEHVHRAVIVESEKRAVGRGRLGQLVDLLAQGSDVLAGLAERVGQFLVLGDRLGQFALGLQQLLLQGADPLGCVLQAAPERDDLFFEDLGLVLEFGDSRSYSASRPCDSESAVRTTCPSLGFSL